MSVAGIWDGLFGGGEAGECERLLARWLANSFALDRPNDLFALMARRGVHLHPVLWHALASAVAHGDQSPDADTLARWVSLLLAAVPPDANGYELLDLGKCCASAGLAESLLDVFEAMAASSLVLEEVPWPEPGPLVTVKVARKFGHWPLSRLYENHLKPILDQIAEPLLGTVVHRLENEHRTLNAWQSANREWDSTSHGRSAIGPHEQDRHPQAIDVLIDAARDCLEHLAASQPDVARRWCDHLARATHPLLRRFAVHTLTARNDLCADQKVDWILSNIGLYDRAARHELFQAVRVAYPDASTSRRRAIVDAILEYEWPRPDDEHRERRTAYRRFEWLQWLRDSDPECDVVGEALDEVKQDYPDFPPQEHPDLTHRISVGAWTPQSPWSVDDLLSRPGTDWLDELLAFEGRSLFEPNREGLLAAVQEAASRDFGWGLGLADALAASSHWNADLWPTLMRSWVAELDEDKHRRVLSTLDSPGLYPHHVRAAAETLSTIVRSGVSYLPALLDEANQVAAGIWDYCEHDESNSEDDDWVRRAVNHPAGMLAEFWVQSIWVWRETHDPAPDTLREDYSAALLHMIHDREVSGTLGRAVLARNLEFLLAADEQWTMEHLVPLFWLDGGDDYGAVWSGLVYQGLRYGTANALGNATLQAARGMNSLFPSSALRAGFVRFFAGTITNFVDKPLDDWIPAFFGVADEVDRRCLAQAVGDLLDQADDAVRREWWDRWLKRYWENRLQGVPAELVDSEAAAMLHWLRGASALFPEVVEIATKTPVSAFPVELFYEAAEGGPWLEYPDSTGRLLVHLGKLATPQPWERGDLRALVGELLGLSLPYGLKGELEELRTRLGS